MTHKTVDRLLRDVGLIERIARSGYAAAALQRLDDRAREESNTWEFWRRMRLLGIACNTAAGVVLEIEMASDRTRRPDAFLPLRARRQTP